MKFTIFQHVPHEHAGLFGKCAKQRGVQLNIIKLWEPYTMPAVSQADALIILGGPMGVYEEFFSKADELNFIKQALGKIPIIGFCLGSQLLAHALGAKVYPNEKDGKRIKEIGYYNVELTPDGKEDKIFQSFSSPIKVLQWHGDAFDLPGGATLLATSKDCVNQAFRFGEKAYGMLFHNEFTPQMVEKQIEIDKKWIHENFIMDEEKLKQEAKENAGLMEQQCQKLLDNFISTI